MPKLGLGLGLDKVHLGTTLNLFELLFDSTGEPLYDSNSQRLTAIKS